MLLQEGSPVLPEGVLEPRASGAAETGNAGGRMTKSKVRTDHGTNQTITTTFPMAVAAANDGRWLSDVEPTEVRRKQT